MDIKNRPGIIRQCPDPSSSGGKWVVITPTSYRMMDGAYVYNCSTLENDASKVIGCLPPDELDSTEWHERYTLPKSCATNDRFYEPFWDCEFAHGVGRWLSRHISSGCLYDRDGKEAVARKLAEQPTQTQGDTVDSPASQSSSILTKPGVIRQCSTDDRKWVVVTPTSFRWMEMAATEDAFNCSTMQDDSSEVIGCLPPDERDSTKWCERYALSGGCINHPEAYEPVWDCCAHRWLSRSLASDRLYNVNGTLHEQKISVPQPTQGDPVTDSSASAASPSDLDKPQFQLRPGTIRLTADNTKWVVIDSTRWRWMDCESIHNAPGLSDDVSTVVGLLPPGELESTVWREAFTLPYPCIHNEREYEPHWDYASSSWVSRYRANSKLYDVKGRPVDAPKESFASAAVRIFKKYW